MKNLTLVKKINLLIFCMISIIGVVAFIQFKSSNDSLVKSVEEKFYADSVNISNAITNIFYERYFDVQAFSLNQTLHNPKDKAGMTDLLNTLSSTYGVYDVIMVVDNNGDYVASSDSDSFGFSFDTNLLKSNYSNSQWFKKSMAGEYTKGKIFSQTYFEPAQLDEVSSKAIGKKVYGTSFSTQLKNAKGEVLGVITCRANLKWVTNIFKDAYKNLKNQGFHTTELSLIDNTGVVLFEYDPYTTKSDLTTYDDNVIGKLNLAPINKGASQTVLGKQGTSYSLHPKKNVEELTGHSLLDQDKFVSGFNWGVLVRIGKKEALGTILENQNIFLATVLLTMLLTQILSFFAVRYIGKKFITESSKLKSVSEVSSNLSQTLCDTSDSVANAAVQQSAAIQESVSALSEMASMISQTAISAKVSMDVVQRVNDKTKDGERVMEEMIFAIQTIEEANLQLQKISQIIVEVSDKTNIINDIVFKTQLLSFNASIEAARAGQHGRGFAVVAEEVGNLAKVSGSAAKDIELMLKNSQKQVQLIVSSLQDKITKCSSVSSHAVKSFNDISTDIQGIVSQIRGITEACDQQELGIQQTSTAMNQIDTATQRNSLSADDARKAARLLSEENNKLKNVTEILYTLVNGNYSIEQDLKSSHSNSTQSSNVVTLDQAVKLLVEKRSGKSDQNKAS